MAPGPEERFWSGGSRTSSRGWPWCDHDLEWIRLRPDVCRETGRNQRVHVWKTENQRQYGPRNEITEIYEKLAETTCCRECSWNSHRRRRCRESRSNLPADQAAIEWKRCQRYWRSICIRTERYAGGVFSMSVNFWCLPLVKFWQFKEFFFNIITL